MKCSKCNAELPEVAKFCLMCGAEVIRERICSRCGHKLEEQAKFCMLCGTPADAASEKKQLKVGDIISYGKNNRSWIVLDIRQHYALLLTQGSVGSMPYHSSHDKVLWKDSSLRHWIYHDCMPREFAPEELPRLPRNKDGDILFLLNPLEAEKYQEILPILSTDPTYGCDQWWWIQTTTEPTNYVPFVRPSEKRVDTYGNGMAAYSDGTHVRLAMWMQLP